MKTQQRTRDWTGYAWIALAVVLVMGIIMIAVMFGRLHAQSSQLKKLNREIGELSSQTANYYLSIDACHDMGAIESRATELGMQVVKTEQVRGVRLLRADENPTEMIAANRRAAGITG